MISSKHQQHPAPNLVRLRKQPFSRGRRRRWTPDDSRGLMIALAILCAWTWTLATLLTTPLSRMTPWEAAGAILLQMFLHTGLFVTAHEGLHGSITPSRPDLNRAVKLAALTLFAWFSGRNLEIKHWEHHLHPGDPAHDPESHNGFRDRFDTWYARYMMNHGSLERLVGMAVAFNLLLYAAGLPAYNLLLFWLAPALLSTLQVFLFATWLPHHEPQEGRENPHHCLKSGQPAWLSFLTCYHLSHQLEHHNYPRIPWWRLPAVHAGKLNPGPAFVVPPESSSPSLS